MSTTTKKISTAIAAVGLCTIGFAGIGAPAALAAPTQQTSVAGSVLAEDPTSLMTIEATAPRTLTVHADPGTQVTLTAPGVKTRKAVANKSGEATFRKLPAGTVFTAHTPDAVESARALQPVGPASDLRVIGTDEPGAVDLSWKHVATPARGGQDVVYRIEATPIDASDAQVVTTQVTGHTSTRVRGLDPQVRYQFTVTPTNQISEGAATTARMTRSIADITGQPTSAATQQTPKSAPAPVQASQPTPAPAPAPAPQPAKPATKTIYICPDGYSDNGANCLKTQPYTYSKQMVGTTPTYSATCDAVRTVWKEGSEQVEHYGYPCIQGGDPIYQDVKDAPPMGWTDNGTAYQLTADKIALEVLA